MLRGDVVKLANTQDLKSCAYQRLTSSILVIPTNWPGLKIPGDVVPQVGPSQNPQPIQLDWSGIFICVHLSTHGIKKTGCGVCCGNTIQLPGSFSTDKHFSDGGFCG